MSEAALLERLPPTAIPPIDLPPAEQLVFSKVDALYEIGLYQNTDGSSDMIMLDKRIGSPIDSLDLPEPLQEFGFDDPAQKIAYDRIAGDLAEARKYLGLNADQQAVVTALGLELATHDPDGAVLSVHVPSETRINSFLDFVREKTGFAMGVE